MARLEEICSLITDGSHFSPEDEGVGYPMFSVKDMTPNGFNISGCKKIGEEAYKKLVANGCKPLNDDVVVAKDGSYLKTAFVIKGNPEIALLSSIAILRPKIDLVVPEYLSYFLKSDAVYRTVSLNYITGTALKRIILKGIRKIEVDLPDIGEQEQRAQRLSKVDYLCQLRKQQLDKLDELVKARFVEMFGNKDYPRMKWNNVFNTTTGKLDSNAAVDNGKYPFFTCSKEPLKIDSYAFDQTALLLAGNNAAGKYDVKYYQGKFNAYQRTYVLSLKHNWSYKLFQYQLEDKLLYLQTKSLGGLTKYLTLKILGELDFIVPPLALQNEFAAFVEHVDEQKQTVQQSLEKLELMKKALMQEYFG